MDRESVVFLIDASPAMLRRAPGATTHAVDGARPDASSSNAATGRGGAGSAVTTYLDVALDCARGMLRDRVVSAPSDKQGVVFFNTTRTRGLDDHLDGLSARENVFVYHRAAPPSARRIQDLGDLIGRDNEARFRETVGVRDIVERVSPEGASTEARNASADATYYDALLRAHHVAREMLNDHPPTQRVAKRCLLFTNRDAPLPEPSSVTDATALSEDGRELIGQWREFANVHKIDVRLFALPRTISDDERDAESSNVPLRVAPFDASKFYDNLVTCCAEEEDEDDALEGERSGDASAKKTKTGGRASDRAEGVLTPTGHELVAFHGSGDDGAIHASNGGFGLDSVTRAFRARTRRMRKVRSVALRFGSESGEKIAVSLYAPFAAAKRPKPVKVHCRDLSEVHCETVFVNTAVGAYVEREALHKKFINVGDKKAVVTQNELADAKRAVEEEGIHLFGFREDSAAFRETFLRWARTGRPARLARPEGADDAGHKKGGHNRRDAERTADAAGSSGGGFAKSRFETASNAAAFFALVDAMRRKRRVGVGITARTGSRDAGARGCVLVPAEDADGELIGLRVIDAPFADDVRHPERVHDFARMAEATAAASASENSAFDAVVGSRGATAAQVRSAEEVIDALAVHAYDPADIANPALARHYRVLECQALDAPWTDADERDVDGTKPPSVVELESVGVRGPIEAFKLSTYGVNHDAEVLEDASVKPPPSKRLKALGGGLDDDPIDFVLLAKSDDLERCTAAALKAYCKEKGLKTTGVKSALAERVKEHALDGGG
jgi:hypothetical protein